MDKQKILIVDFDPAFLGVIEQLLETRGWDTTTTWDMSEASALLGSQDFGVIIAGHHPPTIQADAILKRLQPKPQPPLCIVTLGGNTHPFEAEHLRSLGAYAIVSKWDQRELVDVVEKAAGKAPGAVAD